MEPMIALTTGVPMLVRELSSYAFGFTLTGISQIFQKLSEQHGSTAHIVHQRLEKTVPKDRMKIVHALMKDLEALRSVSQTVNVLVDSIDKSSEMIRRSMEEIWRKLDLKNQLRFYHFSYWWSSESFDYEFVVIERESKTLNTNFDLMINLLPSCIIAMISTDKTCLQLIQQQTSLKPLALAASRTDKDSVSVPPSVSALEALLKKFDPSLSL